ncbi:dentin sialophosphoprotein [Marinobacter caseinilyticus]|uniref:dentin sialophosphoprotein n=1 Tax=Marinobacter caseinilyticus TaxID=2692195 RepID=UPI00140E1D0B|nr:dentin sialophosphoprotein [Marinobacter caseinilyticus]
MKTQKNLLAMAIALSLGLSGYAVADQGGDGDPNTNADDFSTANNDHSGNTHSGNDNSNNADNSTDVADSFKIADSGNDNSDNSTDVSDSFKIKDSGNDNSDNSTDVSDSFKIKDSGNDNSDNSDSSTSMLDLNVSVFLNNADLEGSVSGITTTYGDAIGGGSYTEVTHRNEFSGGSANFTGVGAIAQNAGNASVTQANVSVMSNLTTGN